MNNELEQLRDERDKLFKELAEIKSELTLSTDGDDEKPLATIQRLSAKLYAANERAEKAEADLATARATLLELTTCDDVLNLAESLAKASAAIIELRADKEKAERDLDAARRELIAHRERAQGNYWAWQGDGEDHLESLVADCPVVISASQLRKVIESKERFPKNLGELITLLKYIRSAQCATESWIAKLTEAK